MDFNHFIRTTQDLKAPNINLVFVLAFIVFLVFIARNIKAPRFYAASAIIFQIIMMIWYQYAGIFGEFGLPLYHCRIAVWALSIGILFKIKSPVLVLFALLGIPASLIVLLMRDMHTFAFPHITNFYYLIVHGLIFLISVNYLDYFRVELSKKKILKYTFITHIMIYIVDILLNANYGYLVQLPLIDNEILNKFSFLIVTVIIFCFVCIMNVIMKQDKVKKFLKI